MPGVLEAVDIVASVALRGVRYMGDGAVGSGRRGVAQVFTVA